MSNYRNRIGEAIAFARNVAGRSQQELADMLGREQRKNARQNKGAPPAPGPASPCAAAEDRLTVTVV